MKRNTKKVSLIISAIAIAVAVVALLTYNLLSKNNSQIANSEQSKSNTSEELKRPKILEGDAALLVKEEASDIILGNKNATITVIEYASLSCPHCAEFYSNGFSKLKADYLDTNKIKFIYRDFPLNQPALAAGMLALCQVDDKSADAEKYYNFLKVLFRTQESWAYVDNFNEKLKTIAKLDGMSDEKIDNCMSNKKLQEQILKSRLSAANLLQIESTPTFIVNGELINGYSGYDAIKNLIEKKLAEKPKL